MPPFQLLACTAADLEQSFAITENAMRDYVARTWGSWDHEQQRQRHHDGFRPASHRFILVGDAVAGILAVEDEPDHIALSKLYLLASYRGLGLGSAILALLDREARAAGKPIRLQVLRVNRGARRLYERHGYRVVRETPERFFMESGDGEASSARRAHDGNDSATSPARTGHR